MYLQVKELSQCFGDKTVLSRVSIELQQGELVTLLGPSGCGKTTLIKIIGGFLQPSAGQVILEGKDITSLPPEQRPVATVFQNYALFPHMTVLENVMYGLRYQRGYKRSQAREAAGQMLAMVHLQELAGQNVTRLSGGQQQRVALARALVLQPRVLLLDEPLSNLDAKLRVRIRQEIKDIQQKLGMTMLFVTHDQEEALSISDHIVVMQHGRVEQAGTPQEIYQQPGSAFVADFIGRANLLQNGADTKLLRPEQLIPAAGGAYRGTILRKQFMGAYTSYFVGTDAGILQADIRSQEDRDWQIGDTLELAEWR